MPGPVVAIVQFPGSNDDHDAAWALAAVGADPLLVWHDEPDLPDETGAVVDRTFPLEKLREAHEYLEDRRQLGKVVIEVP